MARILGFALAALGLGAIALSLKSINESFSASLPFLADIPNYVLIIVGIVLIGLAVFLARGGKIGRQLEEVPIYHGKEIVGYRRVGRR